MFFFALRFETKHNITVHLYKTAITIIRESFVAREPRQSCHGFIVEPQVQYGVHHTGHAHTRTRAHGKQERVFGTAENGAHYLLDFFYVRQHFLFQTGRQLHPFAIEECAHFSGDCESGRDRYTEVHHIREPGSFSTKQVL